MSFKHRKFKKRVEVENVGEDDGSDVDEKAEPNAPTSMKPKTSKGGSTIRGIENHDRKYSAELWCDRVMSSRECFMKRETFQMCSSGLDCINEVKDSNISISIHAVLTFRTHHKLR